MDTDRRLLATGVASSLALYLCLGLAGSRPFLYKSALLPALLAYSLTVRESSTLLTDWLPLVSGTVLFDVLRGAIYVAIERGALHAAFAQYVIDLERNVLGVAAAPLLFLDRHYLWIDRLAVLIHSSHFLWFLIVGFIVWHGRRSHFARYRRAILLTIGVGILGYALLPTVPPWMAADPLGLLPAIPRRLAAIYNDFIPADLYRTFETNPVAAMPSLHAAFPTVCAWALWRAYGPIAGLASAAYALAMMLAVVYLGEHYAVDVFAGVALAVGAIAVSRRPWSASWSLPKAVALSVVLTAAAYFLFQIQPSA